MSRMSELDTAVAELRKCGEALIGISETLRTLFSAVDAVEPEKAAEQAPAALSLEDVRGVLAQKSAEGHTAEIQALIRGYGASRLSEVDSRHYAELLRKAEVL
ncbi:MAG: hypothetical protein Q4B19_07920 [Clostridia bacterium]|nr:hypothetical protein [Clostridia bacterium]